MTNEQLTRLFDLAHNQSLSQADRDVVRAAYDRLTAVEPTCEHDLQKPNHTLIITHDLRSGREYDSTAKCRVCKEEFMHPLHSP